MNKTLRTIIKYGSAIFLALVIANQIGQFSDLYLKFKEPMLWLVVVFTIFVLSRKEVAIRIFK